MFKSLELKKLFQEAEKINIEKELPYDEYIDGEPRKDFMVQTTI